MTTTTTTRTRFTGSNETPEAAARRDLAKMEATTTQYEVVKEWDGNECVTERGNRIYVSRGRWQWIVLVDGEVHSAYDLRREAVFCIAQLKAAAQSLPTPPAPKKRRAIQRTRKAVRAANATAVSAKAHFAQADEAFFAKAAADRDAAVAAAVKSLAAPTPKTTKDGTTLYPVSGRAGQTVYVTIPEDDDSADDCADDRWIVRCRVSGGVTGTRESVLKSDGATKYFATEDAATTEAARLMTAANGDRYRTASFQYWADRA